MQAYKWIGLAASSTTGDQNEEYTAALNKVADLMTSQQIAEAERLAREWTTKKR